MSSHYRFINAIERKRLWSLLVVQAAPLMLSWYFIDRVTQEDGVVIFWGTIILLFHPTLLYLTYVHGARPFDFESIDFSCSQSSHHLLMSKRTMKFQHVICSSLYSLPCAYFITSIERRSGMIFIIEMYLFFVDATGECSLSWDQTIQWRKFESPTIPYPTEKSRTADVARSSRATMLGGGNRQNQEQRRWLGSSVDHSTSWSRSGEVWTSIPYGVCTYVTFNRQTADRNPNIAAFYYYSSLVLRVIYYLCSELSLLDLFTILHSLGMIWFFFGAFLVILSTDNSCVLLKLQCFGYRAAGDRIYWAECLVDC